ncbi:pentapeptide repeat-containing protein [Rhodovulum visakhapatnamense]|uniref:Pentapeptide repeat-containing protein n=1 Tax=Rhodovulum visakhapatnamense TaxID=364297 RepID=A0ABS1RGP1_9RHOB|nr:pentapeptide repeat-containing protein [Rhodovulum visakhapatnamense]MBL3578811.1 pentapeptide repeat-containing protein [Rhodovulum visakhapatnamense]
MEKHNNAEHTQAPYRLDLKDTNLQFTDLRGGDFSDALLTRARLEGAILANTHFRRAALEETHLAASDLRKAQLEGAILWAARLDSANLSGAKISPLTQLWSATLRGARVNRVDFRETDIECAQIETAFGDGSTQLRLEARPRHWPSEPLSPTAFQREWLRWRADPASYVPPQDRA